MTPTAPTTLVKAAIAWDGTGFSYSVDGQTVQTVALPWPMWAFLKLAIGRSPSSGVANGHLKGELKGLRYYPARLPTAALQAMTAP